jgi:hypothetical protein
MKTWSEKALARDKVQEIGFAVAVPVASMSVVAAQEQPRHPRNGFNQNPPCASQHDCDRGAHDKSGTRGRKGLGANPEHPEGPGNAAY